MIQNNRLDPFTAFAMLLLAVVFFASLAVGARILFLSGNQ